MRRSGVGHRPRTEGSKIKVIVGDAQNVDVGWRKLKGIQGGGGFFHY